VPRKLHTIDIPRLCGAIKKARLVLCSVTFPEVAEGEAIPALEAHFVSPL